MKCSECGCDHPDGARFCGQCGNRLVLSCSQCGAEAPSTFRFCGQCGTPFATQPSPQPASVDETDAPTHLSEERRHLTVMFCDLVDSTNLAARVDPEELHHILKQYQSACSDVIEPYEGHIAQYLGDGLLVYFGFPRAHEDDAHRAVYAGLGILTAMEELNQRFEQEGRPSISVRIGIDTGDVVTGAVGVGRRSEHLALGQTPNRAARVQSLAEPDTVFLSEATHRLVAKAFECESLGAHELKGFDQPVKLYRALRTVSSLPAFERFGSLKPPVGRDAELAALEQAYHDAQDGRGQVVFLNGEAGIGKSRLVSVLYRRVLDDQLKPTTCQCSPFSQNSAYYPVLSLVVDRCQWHRGDSNEQKLTKLESWLRSLDLSVELAHAFPLIANLLSIPLQDDRYPLPDWSVSRIKQRSLETLLDLLEHLGGPSPTVLIFEDLHWIDPSTEELLDRLVEQVASKPMLLILTHRPDYDPPWPSAEHFTHLRLDRLDFEGACAIIERISGDRALPASLIQVLVDRTDGVPLYLEEITKMILESDLSTSLHELPDVSSSGKFPALSIPETLQDSLMARLDRLGSAKEIAQIGSILGREFSFDLIRAITHYPESVLETKLNRLTQAELLHRTGHGRRARYLFKHSLVQEAAYNSLLRRERQKYHALISDVLVEHFPDITDYQPEVVARHLQEAQLPERAVDFLRRAGDRALARSALIEATGHLRAALGCLESLPPCTERSRQELGLLNTLGASLSNAKGFAAPEVERVYDQALRLCRDLEDTPELFWILWGLRRFHLVRSEIGKAVELSERLLHLADAEKNPDQAIAARLAVGATLFCSGNPKEALRHLEDGIRLDTPTRDFNYASQVSEDSGVACLCWSAWSLWFLGRPEEAERRIREAVALAERLRHSLSQIYAVLFATYLASFQRDFKATLASARELVQLCREHGSWWEALGLMFVGWAKIMDQDASADDSGLDGIELVHQGIDGYVGSGARLLLPQMLSIQAEVLLQAGRLEPSREVLERATAMIEQTDERVYQAEVLRLWGELERAGGDERSAETHFHEALAVAQSQEGEALGLRIQVSLARLRARQGRHQEIPALLESYGRITEPETADLAEARRLLGEAEARLTA